MKGMDRRVPEGASEAADGVEVVRIGVDGDVAVERLRGRAMRGRRYALSLPGLLALCLGHLLLLAAGVVVLAQWYALPLPTFDPELPELLRRYLRSPAIVWLGYGVSPAAMIVCLFLSGVDMRRDQAFCIFALATLVSIALASWKTILPRHWLGIPVFSVGLWIIAYANTAILAAKLRSRLARRRQ